jgi:hypothetical protein
MPKVMVGIPVIYCPPCVQKCIDHLKNQDCEIFIIDNNAEPRIKQIIAPYKKTVNEKNVYVNPAWNQIIAEFLVSDNDILIIQNSDLYLKSDVISKVKSLDLDNDKIIPCLHLVNSFTECSRETHVVPGGVAGVFIPLTRKMAELVYPIPAELKLWFGDNWIYEKLQKHGYELTVFSDLQATHQWSSSVNALPEAAKIIEGDKIAWKTVSTLI